MADKKITELPETTSVANADLLVVETNPATTPATSKMQWTNIKVALKAYFDGLYAILAHTHTGTSDSPKLAQANTHETPDTDSAASSLHHTLGTGANQATAGNDSRLSDARTPTAHATSHKNGGGDEVATATPGTNSIPKTGASSQLAIGWLASGTPDGTKFVRDDGTLVTPSGASGANPTATVGPTATNGSAGTFMRSDGAPALANTTVTPGSYTNTDLTVDAQGRITAAANGTGGGVARSGSTTDGHLAVWNGSNADSLKDGGVPGSGGGDFLGAQVFS